MKGEEFRNILWVRFKLRDSVEGGLAPTASCLSQKVKGETGSLMPAMCELQDHFFVKQTRALAFARVGLYLMKST